MMEPTRDVGHLLNKADRMPNGEAKMNVLKEAIQLADLRLDEPGGFLARENFSKVAIEASMYSQMLIHFPWMLAFCDRNPGRVKEPRILVLYEWAVTTIVYFPAVPKDKILEAMEDLLSRIERFGQHRMRILKIRRVANLMLGNLEKAEAAQEAYLDLVLRGGRNGLHPESLEIDTYVHGYFLEKTGKIAEAYEVLKPLLVPGKNSEMGQFARTLMAVPSVVLGHHEEAIRYYREARAMLQYNSGDLAGYNDLVDFLLKTGHLDEAVRTFERLAQLNEAEINPQYAMYSHFISENLFRSLAAQNRQEVMLRLPDRHPRYSAAGRYDPVQLADFYRNRGNSIAEAFDRRNGNTFTSSYMKRKSSYRTPQIFLDFED